MKTLCIANQKGGVGKSTLTAHLGWWAEQQGIDTLLVDLDGQSNTTRTFTDAPTGLAASQLFEEEAAGEPQRISRCLALIHADLGINDVEGLPLDTIELPARHLRRFDDRYDLCIIDTPPSLGRRLLAALIASDVVVSPLALNGYSLQGIEALQQTIIRVRRRFNRGLRNLGILPNMVNRRSKTQGELLDALRESLGDRVLPFELVHRVAVSDAVDQGRPVWRGTRGQSSLRASAEMRVVCKEIIERVLA